MTAKSPEPPVENAHVGKKLILLILVIVMICVSIFVIQSFLTQESQFVDNVVGDIQQEMDDNHIELSSGGGRRTVVDFKEPIILTHGNDSRLIVYTARLSENVTLADEGWGGIKCLSTYQDAVYYGLAEYTVDLSQLSEEDFIVNNELKILTVRIPYAVLSPITILDDETQFYDPQKGWAAPKDIELTPEEYTIVMMEIKEKMKAQLIDEDMIATANEEAKIVVAELLTATVQAVDPEFTVVIVQ